MNIHVKVFVWTYVFIFLGYLPGHGIAVSNGNCMPSFLWNYKLHSRSVPLSQHFECIIPLSLTSIISDKKSVFNCFSLYVFKTFSLFLTFESLTVMCLGVNFSVSPTSVSWTFLDSCIQDVIFFFIIFGKFSAIISLKNFFVFYFLYLGTPITCTVIHLLLSHTSEMDFLFFQSFW